MKNDNNADIIEIIDMMVAVKRPKDELFAFCMENMPKLISDCQNIPLPFNQTAIPFCQFDFEQQSKLYQEFYRNLRRCGTQIRPLIYDMVLDYVKNNIPDIPVRSENRLYLTALRNAAEHYVQEFGNFSMNASQRMMRLDNFEKRIMEYIFGNHKLIDYLKSIGCMEVTIMHSLPKYWSTSETDIHMQEIWNFNVIMGTIINIRRLSGGMPNYKGPGIYAYTEHKSKNVFYLEPHNCIEMPGFGTQQSHFNYRYRLPENITNAIKKDDVASFMINMQLQGKRVCDTLLKILAIEGKTRILTELMSKYPTKCKDMVFLLIGGHFSPKTFEIMKTLEEINPGTIYRTLDKLGQNLLWYAFAQTNDFGELEQFLISCGCDPENKMHNLSYRRFKELYLQYTSI